MYNRQLDTFIKVADAGSFSKASNTMYISPTAVIKQINLLESDLGLQLFVRTNRGLTLTSAGKSLYKDAKYIIGYSQDSLVRARQAMSRDEKTIRIGTSLMTPSNFLVDLWPRITEHNPELKLQLIPYENTQENAKEILQNMGQNIDVVAGIFDSQLLAYRKCDATVLTREPICVAVSIHHRLADRDKLSVQDLYGENLMLIERGRFQYVDMLRDELWQHHSQIHVIDFPFYNIEVFNQCENSSDLLMAMGYWSGVHPLLKIIPVDWAYRIPFGILHAPKPSEIVTQLLNAIKTTFNLKDK